MLVWINIVIRESMHTQRGCRELELPVGSLQLKLLNCIWSCDHTQYSSLIGHSLHPCNACLSLATAHMHTMLAFHWPCLASMQHLFPESFCWFLPVARCICQHQLGSSQLKVICYNCKFKLGLMLFEKGLTLYPPHRRHQKKK